MATGRMKVPSLTKSDLLSAILPLSSILDSNYQEYFTENTQIILSATHYAQGCGIGSGCGGVGGGRERRQGRPAAPRSAKKCEHRHGIATHAARSTIYGRTIDSPERCRSAVTVLPCCAEHSSGPTASEMDG